GLRHLGGVDRRIVEALLTVVLIPEDAVALAQPSGQLAARGPRRSYRIPDRGAAGRHAGREKTSPFHRGISSQPSGGILTKKRGARYDFLRARAVRGPTS